MPTRAFTREQLDALDLPGAWADDAPEILHREQVDSRRWVSVHELIFRAPDDGKAYRVHYEQGLTESQDDTDPWNGDRTVEAVEVEQRTRTVEVTEWHPVDEQPQRPAGLDALLGYVAANLPAADPRPVITVDLEQPAEPPTEKPLADNTVTCTHGYGLMRDSCPGCDHEQETPHEADPVTVRPMWAKRDMRRCRRCALVPSHKIHRTTAAEAQR
jgi:hypothetical protein